MKSEAMKTEKYRVISHMFKGYTGNDEYPRYTYEITFNKSLEHIGKFKGIEDGLNRYDKIEPWKELINSLKDSFRLFMLGVKRIF